jgi:hypothetical protein
MPLKAQFRGLTVKECIQSAAESEVGAHVELAVISEAGHWWVTCTECGSRWSVELSQVDTGDMYCVEGATNYYGSDGNLLKRS